MWQTSDITCEGFANASFKEVSFQPKTDDEYYYPCYESIGGYKYMVWSNSSIDRRINSAVDTFKTSDGAFYEAISLWGDIF